MNFALSYSGPEGDLDAVLSCDGVTVSTGSGFKDKKAVEKWADQAARDHKVEHTPQATHTHSISGSKTFTL